MLCSTADAGCMVRNAGTAQCLPRSQVLLGCLKHQWNSTNKLNTKVDVIARLEDLISELLLDTSKADLCATLSTPGTPTTAPHTPTHTSRVHFSLPGASGPLQGDPMMANMTLGRPGGAGGLQSMTQSMRMPSRLNPGQTLIAPLARARGKPGLLAKAYFCLAQWQQAVAGKAIDDAQACHTPL